jgi:hypothetical protein
MTASTLRDCGVLHHTLRDRPGSRGQEGCARNSQCSWRFWPRNGLESERVCSYTSCREPRHGSGHCAIWRSNSGVGQVLLVGTFPSSMCVSQAALNKLRCVSERSRILAAKRVCYITSHHPRLRRRRSESNRSSSLKIATTFQRPKYEDAMEQMPALSKERGCGCVVPSLLDFGQIEGVPHRLCKAHEARLKIHRPLQAVQLRPAQDVRYGHRSRERQLSSNPRLRNQASLVPTNLSNPLNTERPPVVNTGRHKRKNSYDRTRRSYLLFP